MTAARIVLCIGGLLLTAGPALAQAPSDERAADTSAPADSLWQLDMDPVVVTATRTERQTDEVAVPVSVIGQDEIAHRERRGPRTSWPISPALRSTTIMARAFRCVGSVPNTRWF